MTGCHDGCTGEPLLNQSAFLGCYAGRIEGTCVAGTRASCAAKAGVDDDALAACAKDEALVKSLMVDIAARSKRILSVPTMKLNGKTARNDPESAKEIKTALCEAGAEAAC